VPAPERPDAGPGPLSLGGGGFGRRGVRWSLAVLWLLDAALQLQPGMFTRSFAGNVLYNSALMYQPHWLEQILYPVAGLEARDVTALTVGIFCLQLAIGIGILWPRTLRAALAISIFWAAGVWVFGQGLGFMATGTAMVEFGAPGSALLYIVLALLIWPGRTLDAERAGTRGHPWAAWAWSGFWGLGALLHIPLRYSAAAVLAYNFQTAAQLEPGALSAFDYSLARFAYQNSASLSIILAAVELLLAVLIWVPHLRRPTLAIGILATALFWVLGQAMGGIATGIATDPSTGPLVVLLGLFAVTDLEVRPLPAPGIRALLQGPRHRRPQPSH
jgi:hypothetical protein